LKETGSSASALPLSRKSASDKAESAVRTIIYSPSILPAQSPIFNSRNQFRLLVSVSKFAKTVQPQGAAQPKRKGSAGRNGDDEDV
jgi:hypothetical protein